LPWQHPDEPQAAVSPNPSELAAVPRGLARIFGQGKWIRKSQASPKLGNTPDSYDSKQRILVPEIFSRHRVA